MRPPEHGGGDIGIGDQVRQRSRRLGLVPTPVPGDRHRFKQPIDNGAASGTDNRGSATGIGGGNVGEQRRNPKLEAGADLVVGRGQYRTERLPENRGGDACLLRVMEDLLEGVAGFMDGVLDSGV